MSRLAALACVLAGSLVQGEEVATVEEVEAAYLHKFLSYVDWPPGALPAPGAPFAVGVAGSDKVYELLVKISQGRLVQGRGVEVQRLSAPEEAANVQLVFVGRAAWKDLPGWVVAARGHALVVATDTPGGVERGATLGFVQSGRQVRFQASLIAAEQAGVHLSSRLLVVAERVWGMTP